jgi:hypothetical protein
MSTIILKNNPLLSPTIFFNEQVKSKNIHRFTFGGSKRVTAENSYIISFDDINEYTTYFPRGNSIYIGFYGGLMASDTLKIIALIVKNSKGIDFGLVDKDFSIANPTAFKRIKSSFKQVGINTKTNLILGSYTDITKTYLELLNPTMESYKEEVQFALSSEFLESIKQPTQNKTRVEVEEDDDETPF